MPRVREEVVGLLKSLVQSFTPHEAMDFGGVEVRLALEDEAVARIILEVLRFAPCPVKWRELVYGFEGVVGEARLRRILRDLAARGQVAMLTGARYCHPSKLSGEYTPRLVNVLALRRSREEGKL